MTIILEETNQLDFHSDLSKVVKPISEQFKSLNWLLTNLEYIIFDTDRLGAIDKLNHEDEAIILTGGELYEIIINRQIQFIWGVLTGFKSKVPEIKSDKLPYADQNEDLWTKPEKFQVESAEMEIVCWDSSLTLIKLKDKELGYEFLKSFPEGKILKTSANN